jgi:ABC-type uncharacterized transport system ATPase subunit
MTSVIEKGTNLEVNEAFSKLQDRFNKYSKLESDILDPELREKTAKLIEYEIHESALALVRARAGADAAHEAAATSQKKTWTQAEIRDLRIAGKMTDSIMEEIREAVSEGRVV